MSLGPLQVLRGEFKPLGLLEWDRVERAVQAGFDFFFPKPITAAQITIVLDAAAARAT